MAFIDWSQQYSVGVRQFDDQHKKLIALVNELHEAMKSGKGKEVLAHVLGELVSYTRTHFKAEEQLMQIHAYPDAAAHRQLHEELTEKAVALKRDLEAGNSMLTLPVMDFLKTWLQNHIMGTDKKYTAFFNGKGVQ